MATREIADEILDSADFKSPRIIARMKAPRNKRMREKMPEDAIRGMYAGVDDAWNERESNYTQSDIRELAKDKTW